MKKFYLLLIALAPIFFVSCGDDDSELIDEMPKEQPNESKISVSDDVVGVGQSIMLSVDYKTDNPNILVSWFDNGERISVIIKNEMFIEWRPKTIGDHEIQVAITDREKVITCTKMINVVETELGYGIIGDSKEKIARTCGVEGSSNTIVYKQNLQKTYKYYFSDNKLYKISYDNAVALNPSYQADYMQPYTYFSGYYYRYTQKYGEPIRENFTNIMTDDTSKMVLYGGRILSGSMSIEAVFVSSDREAGIYIGPYSGQYGSSGFTFSEYIMKK